MKKKWIIVIALSATLLVGCNGATNENQKEGDEKMTSTNTNINTNKREDKEENSKEMEPIPYFHKLMEDDKQGDEKSVSWDGTNATVVEDEFDSDEISDGRGVSSGSEVASVPGVFELSYPNTLEHVKVVSAEKEDYILTAEHMEIRVQEVEYAKKKAAIESNTNYRKMDASILSEHQTKYFNNYELYTGIEETKQGNYAGYTLLFESNLAEKAYMISVVGIGNMADIQVTALYIMNHFEVLFE